MTQIVRFTEVNKSQVNQVPMKPGQLVFSNDSFEIYLDNMYSERIKITDIIKLDTENDRTGIIAPLADKFYYVKATNKFWYVNEELEWHCVNADVTKESIGLGNVDNTADANKSVKYAENAGKVNNHTVESNVPADAKFTDTTYSNATSIRSGLMSNTDKVKLDGIEEQANNYTHPATHPASMIEGLSSVATSGSYNDLTEKPTNLSDFSDDLNLSYVTSNFLHVLSSSKQDDKITISANVGFGGSPANIEIPAATGTSIGLMTAADKSKLNGLSNYEHPETHPASMITGLADVATSGEYSDLLNAPKYNFVPVTAEDTINAVTWNADTIVPFVPPAAEGYDLGSSTTPWNRVYSKNITLNGTDIEDVFATNTRVATAEADIDVIESKITNVDNTHDKDKRVAYADNAGTVNGLTVKTAVPEGAVFTDTTYEVVTDSKDGLMSSLDKQKLDGLATVAISGLYDDLEEKPNVIDRDTDTDYVGDVTFFSASQPVTGNFNGDNGLTITATQGDINGSIRTQKSVSIMPATTSNGGLMKSTDKAKLDGIAEGANNYVHPESGVTAGTYNSVTVDANGHVTAGSNIEASAISAVDADGNILKNLESTTSGRDEDHRRIFFECNYDNKTLPAKLLIGNGPKIELYSAANNIEDQILIRLDPRLGISIVNGTASSNIDIGFNGDIRSVGAVECKDLKVDETLLVVENNQVSTSGNLLVQGNLTVQGESFVVEAETVTTKDNIIEINKGETGAGVTSGIAGLQVDRGTETAYQMVFDEAQDMFSVGMVGDLEVIATRPWVTEQLTSKLDSSAIHEWALAETKPTYTKAEIGLENVDNTADADKSVSHASTADSATSATTATKATSLATTAWTIEEVDGNLVFKNGGEVKATLYASGKLEVSEIAEV